MEVNYEKGDSMIEIGSGSISEGVSRTKAFDMIRGLGFPRPAPWSLKWYFKVASDKTFVPIVDFKKLANEIDETGIIHEVAQVVESCVPDARKTEVFDRVKKMITSHYI